MTKQIPLKKNSVHLWRALLTDVATHEREFRQLLHADEMKRAERFRFPLHRERFILTRGILRHILTRYINIPPAEIYFIYGPNGKPFLRDNEGEIQFNVSHSHDMAVFAFSLKKEIGVDIEKIEKRFKEGVAKRFFTDVEYDSVMFLPEEKRANAFYRIWSRKEALIKALGEGLYGPIKEFSIQLKNEDKPIELEYQDKNYEFMIKSFDAHPDYQSAFARENPVEHIEQWEWQELGNPKKW